MTPSGIVFECARCFIVSGLLLGMSTSALAQSTSSFDEDPSTETSSFEEAPSSFDDAPVSASSFDTVATEDASPDATPDSSPSFLDRIIQGEIFGNFGAEFRIFPHESLASGQPKHFNASLAFEPGFRLALSDNITFEIVGFLRVDQSDSRRTHWDLREAYWETKQGDFSVGLGVHKVFWGVTESRHLVDIVNQSDFVENINGEAKLGQAMVSLSYTNDKAGTFDLYALSWFRPFVYPGVGGRPRLPIPVRNSEATYESSIKQAHPDVAFRWSKSLGEFDWALSYFYGTSREPELNPTMLNSEPILAPRYSLIHQAGLEVQWTHRAWLWKLESILRAGQGDPFFAVSGGVEYTIYGMGESDVDLGLIAEYNYDGRNKQNGGMGNGTFTIFQNDAFGGFRLAFNDTNSTDFLVGALVDTEHGSVLINAEASRRLGSSWKLILEGRAFIVSKNEDPLNFFRRDHFAEVEIQYHF